VLLTLMPIADTG